MAVEHAVDPSFVYFLFFGSSIFFSISIYIGDYLEEVEEIEEEEVSRKNRKT